MAANQQAHENAGKLAQLLGEVLIHHAPHTARIDAETRRQFTEQFLEELEDHTAEKIGPFLQELFDGVEIPESLRPIVKDAIGPQAQFSAIVTQLFLYGIVSQLLSTSIQPFLQGVTNDLWTKAVDAGIAVPVSPAVIATAAARGLELGDAPTVTMPAWAYTEAAKSGVGAADINLQASIVGTPPAPQELFELQRREIITSDDVARGLAEGDTRDDWIPQLQQLAHGWLTPLDFVRAAVQAQMSYSDAKDWATKTGLDTSTGLPITASDVGGSNDMFGMAWAIAGRPPGPQELATMALRGIIDWEGTGAGATTFQQGIAESDVKTKWTPALRALSTFVPTATEIGSLLERGAIDKATAIGYWEARGVPTALANGYAYIAEQQHIGQDKLLAKSEILAAYYDQLMDKPTALGYLADLGYTGDVATEILAIQDFRREIKAINGVVSKISNQFAAFKLSPADAKTALLSVGIAADQAAAILDVWQTVRTAPIRVPSVREIGLATKAGTITQDEALEELASLGYEGRDAQIVLSAYLTTKVGPLSPPGATVTG
jgi:hypothetical protein